MTKVAVVILNYNGKGYLEKFLPSFVSCSQFPVVVIDNNSTDDSVNFLEKDYPNIQLIKLSDNLGFAGGYNEGLKKVNAEYYLIVNSDIEVTPNWITPLADFLDQNSEYAACQPKIKSYNQKDFFEYAGAAGGFIDKLGFPYCRGRIFDITEKDNGQYESIIDVFWSTGACFMIRSQVFKNLGGFDKDFFAHMEEIDLCWRIYSSGLKIACIPSSEVFHVGGGTLSATSPRKTYLNFRNGLSLLQKNLPARELWKIPFRMVLDWLAALKFGFSNGFSHSFNVLKAHIDFLKLIRRNNRKRKEINQKSLARFQSPTNSIIWSFYIQGKKTFDKL